MFNNSTVEVSTNLAEVMVNQGVRLVPKANTLLGNLSLSVMNAIPVKELTELTACKIAITEFARGVDVQGGSGREYQCSEHDTYMDNYIDTMSTLVANHMSFARGVVNKEIALLQESLNVGLVNYKVREAEDFFNVSYYSLPGLFSSFTITDEISPYVTSKYRRESLNLVSLESEEDLTKYLLTGIDEVDTEISGWLGSLTCGVPHYILGSIQEFGLTLVEQLNYSMVNYLFYRNLAERTDISTGDSLTVLRKKATENSYYFANSLLNAISTYHKQITRGVLLPNNNVSFSYLNSKEVDIVVFEESFKSLASAGYGIETIFGYIASTDSGTEVTVDTLTNAGTKYNDIWSRTRGLYTIHLNKQRLDIFKYVLTSEFEKTIAGDRVSEAEKEILEKDKNFLEETLHLGSEYINQLTVSDLDDVVSIMLELVAKIRFRFSNAADILCRMREILDEDEKIEPMEAALYSLIDHLTDYMLDQATVEKY